MPWWGWLVLGVALLGVEMFVVDAQFYLVFLGISSTLVGLLGLAGVALPVWLQWLVFAVLSVATMLAFRRRVYALVRGHAEPVQERVTPVTGCSCRSASSPARVAVLIIGAPPGRRATWTARQSRPAVRRRSAASMS